MGLFNWFSKEKKPLANVSSNVNASASNLIAVTPKPNVNAPNTSSQPQGQVQGQQGGKRSKSKKAKSKKAKSKKSKKSKKTKSRSRK